MLIKWQLVLMQQFKPALYCVCVFCKFLAKSTRINLTTTLKWYITVKQAYPSQKHTNKRFISPEISLNRECELLFIPMFISLLTTTHNVRSIVIIFSMNFHFDYSTLLFSSYIYWTQHIQTEYNKFRSAKIKGKKKTNEIK